MAMGGYAVWLAAMLCCIAFPAAATPNACGVVATAIDHKQTYPSVVAAVDAMRREHLERSVHSDREFVGAVVKNPDGGFFTSAGSGCSGQDTVTFTIDVPRGMAVAAFWHTHGASAPYRDLFSADDVDLVRFTGRDFYLITPRGDLKVLRPGDIAGIDRVIRTRSAGRSFGATGLSVAPPRDVPEKPMQYRSVLPSESRGDPPVG
jgi:hypothetical protein